MKSGTCPKCNSNRIMANVSLPDYVDYGVPQDTQVHVAANPSAMFLKGMTSSKVEAWICADCGLMEQYVHNTRGLWAAYKKANPSA